MFDRSVVSNASGIAPERIRIFDSVTSTNLLAKQCFENEEDPPELILASAQTAGRGRLGRSFYSPPDAGIYLSYLHRSSLAPEALPMLTVAAAVCTAEAIDECGIGQIGIKWVNDLYLHGKKICGILSESVFSSGYRGSVIGIGINVKKSDMPESLAQIASSLEAETGVCPDPSELAGRIAGKLRLLLPTLPDAFPSILEKYRNRMILLGKDVDVCSGGTSYRARVLGIGENGELIVLAEDGEHDLTVGEVSIRFK